jgi:hypothetical protein
VPIDAALARETSIASYFVPRKRDGRWTITDDFDSNEAYHNRQWMLASVDDAFLGDRRGAALLDLDERRSSASASSNSTSFVPASSRDIVVALVACRAAVADAVRRHPSGCCAAPAAATSHTCRGREASATRGAIADMYGYRQMYRVMLAAKMEEKTNAH